MIMYKAGDLIGKSVVTTDQGRKIEKIHDVLFDVRSESVVGFLLQEKGLFKQALVLPFSKVKVIGPDAVTVENENSVIMADQDEKISSIIESHVPLVGKKIMTEGGEFIGNVSDLFIDEKTGKIEGYEISGGMFSDAYAGKSSLPAPKTIRIGEDVIFVPNDTIDLVNEQVGGIKGTVSKAGQSAKDAATSSKQDGESLKSEFGRLWENVKARSSSLKEQATSKVEEQRIKNALGKPVTRIVLDEYDNVILKTGDIITNEAIEKARGSNALDMLLNSVAKSDPTFTSDELKRKGEQYGDKS